ncbi:hypothetical protein R1sor_005755 [Riccia sorocarpa]|uniref:Centromere protein C n=1 Tax=Riccia sorocarpa TaxID=122646 RepID=A0ABD3HRZ2_9MARC
MATPSTSGTPNVRDVRRARATRFSFSPVPSFGSPSFSLGIDKFPPPPTFDDCDEKIDLLNSDDKQSSKRVRLLNDEAAPSFSLGLEELQLPLDSQDYTREETSERDEGRQSQEIRDDQQCEYASRRNEKTSPGKSKGGAGVEILKDAADRGRSQERAHKVCSGPSFSLGLEESSSSEKPHNTLSRKEKRDSTLSPPFDLRAQDAEFSGNVRPKSPSSENENELTTNLAPVVEACQVHAPKQLRRIGRNAPSPKLSLHLTNEPISVSAVQPRVYDRGSGRAWDAAENTSSATAEVSPTLLSGAFSGSDEDNNFNCRTEDDEPGGSLGSRKHNLKSRAASLAARRVSSSIAEQMRDGPLQWSLESGAVDSTRELVVGMLGKKKDHQEYESTSGQNLPSSRHDTSCPAIIVLSQETDETPSLGKQSLSSGLSKDSAEPNTPTDNVENSKPDNQLTQRVDIIDITTPPSARKASPKRPLRNCRQGTLLEFVKDSEDEGEFEIAPKRRRLSKPTPQVKIEPHSTGFLEDFASSPVKGKDAVDERSPGTPVVEQKKVFKRLRRGSASQAPQVKIDRSAGLKKVKMEPCKLDRNEPVLAASQDLKEFTAGSTQLISQDEFDDIEDVSDCELTCGGSRSHRDRRSLPVHIQPKKLSLSTPSPSGMKPLLHIPGLDSEPVAKKPDQVKTESVRCLETKFSSATVIRKYGNVKAEAITLSDDEEPWLEWPRTVSSQALPTEATRRNLSGTEKKTPLPDPWRVGSRLHVPEPASSSKSKSTVVDGSDFWESFTENFSEDPTAGPADEHGQNEHVRIARLLRERLPHLKAVDALLVDGGLDEEPVYIDYRNQFGSSQGMDRAAFAELDCTQPQSRRKQKRPSSKSMKGRQSKLSSSATTSQKTTPTRSPAKGKRKAWTLFRETTKGPSSSTSTQGYWIVEGGKRVYVKDGHTLSGRSAYMAYKRDSGKKSGTKRKPASKSKR